jgi:hypothetical protein
MSSLRSPSLHLAAAALMLTLSACASGGGGGDGAPRRSANRITAQELEGVAQLDCLQAIQRLRPDWLRTRTSARPAIFVDGMESLNSEALRSLPVASVREMRFLDARDATTRFGTGYVSGAILITTGR